jgi:hypothetical protein
MPAGKRDPMLPLLAAGWIFFFEPGSRLDEITVLMRPDCSSHGDLSRPVESSNGPR